MKKISDKFFVPKVVGESEFCMSEYTEETLSFNPPPRSNQPRPVGLVEENERDDKEHDRLTKHIKQHPVGERGQQYQQTGYDDEPAPVRRNFGPAKAESWVDLHREFQDILDVNALQTYRRHFRALGEKEGFIDAGALHEAMEQFFGQDLERKQILETIAEVDYDNDGKLSYREFLETMCALKNGNKKSRFGNFYKVLVLKNPPWWNQRVGRANAV